jgi:site-specific recombinase XerD
MSIPIPAFFADQIRDYMKHGRKNLLSKKTNKFLIVSRKSKVHLCIQLCAAGLAA